MKYKLQAHEQMPAVVTRIPLGVYSQLIQFQF
jgi:hypothetical protein